MAKFCQKCGTENKNTDRFCAVCGNLLETQKKKRKKKSNKKIWFLMLFISVLLMVITGFIVIGRKSEDIDFIKNRYITLVKERKYQQAYEMLKIEDNPWMTEELFEQSLKDSVLDKSYLEPVRQEEKRWLFFSKWKLIPEHNIAEKVSVEVPGNTEIALNGIVLGETYRKKENENTSADAYELPRIFTGTYVISIRSERYENYEEEVYVDYLTDEIKITEEKLTPKEEFINELKEMGKRVIKDLYTAAINDAGMTDFTNNYADIANLEAVYNDLRNSVQADWKETILEEITFSNFESVEEIYLEGGNTYLKMQLQYDYDYQEAAKEGRNQTKTGTGKTASDIIFELQEDEVKVRKINLGMVY